MIALREVTVGLGNLQIHKSRIRLFELWMNHLHLGGIKGLLFRDVLGQFG